MKIIFYDPNFSRFLTVKLADGQYAVPFIYWELRDARLWAKLLPRVCEHSILRLVLVLHKRLGYPQMSNLHKRLGLPNIKLWCVTDTA